MSLVVALEARNGIILAGDTRGTVGDPRGLTAIADVHRKIFRLTSHTGIGAVGSAELGTALMDGMEGRLESAGHQYMDVVMGAVRMHIRGEFNNWFQAFPVDKRPGVVFALAGYRNDGAKGQPLVYLLASQTDFAPHLFSTGICMIGVPQYATYLSNRYYDRKMPKENAAALAVYLISETASQDPKVGGPIHVAEITWDGGYRELTDREIRTIQARNGKQNQRLKEFFFGGEER